ncbi:hypothetical protein [Burkholderia metallica]|uniref:hypothetical protein n=1 Tax=Burkholderia metallica TaxID=488729 RepID=UPI00157750BE|nr:hypothetical protein [Burkholderia metallica]NTZ09065.1 hypothetical protein [Burkholderia metallica]
MTSSSPETSIPPPCLSLNILRQTASIDESIAARAARRPLASASGGAPRPSVRERASDPEYPDRLAQRGCLLRHRLRETGNGNEVAVEFAGLFNSIIAAIDALSPPCRAVHTTDHAISRPIPLQAT